MSSSFSTPVGLRATTAQAPAPARFRAQAGRRVLLRLLDDEEMKLEGALRTASDDHVDFWSRVAWRQLETPRPVMVSVMLETGMWAATGIATQAAKAGAVLVALDHPLVQSDRRRHPRYNVHWPITAMVGQTTFSGRTIDVSVGGLRFVPNPAPIVRDPIGKWASIAVDLGPQAGPDSTFLSLTIIRAAAESAWGMEFVDLPQRMLDLLSAAIREEVRRGATVQITNEGAGSSHTGANASHGGAPDGACPVCNRHG